MSDQYYDDDYDEEEDPDDDNNSSVILPMTSTPYSSLTSAPSSMPPSPSYSSSLSSRLSHYSSSQLSSCNLVSYSSSGSCSPQKTFASGGGRSWSPLRWLYRRYIRHVRGRCDLLSKRRILCLLISLSVFMLISLQLFHSSLSKSQSATNQQQQFSLDRRRGSNGIDQPIDTSSNSGFPFQLSNFWLLNSGRDRKTATQIDQQLQNIEVRLKENRQILKQIRDKIHLAENPQDLAPPSSDSQSIQSNLISESNEASFYKLQSSASCSSPPNRPGSVNPSLYLNMSQIYDQLPFDNPDGGVWKQGWPIELPSEHHLKSQRLKIFVVPHSHNDPGWIKTFDKYFADQTKPILTGAVEQLNQNPLMKFIWAETSYLSAWWERAPSDQHRELMRELVRRGQIEIVTGGWVMNDEANTHYFSILAQMIEGHEWIADTFGVQPKHGWAIDPFGYSPTMAYLLKAMGFRAMVIQRVHYSIKKYLAQHRQLEFNWRQHWEQQQGPTKEDILCHLEPFYSYDIPHTCGPDPKVCCQFDFKRLPPNRVKCPWKINPQPINEANIEQRANLLLDQYRKKGQLYQTNSLLVPLGDDFRFDKAKEWQDQFTNYQKLFNYINSNEEMNVEIKFATLHDYFESILSEQPPPDSPPGEESSFEAAEAAAISLRDFATQPGPQFPILTGDFFTYCDREDHYWSGYYTSKPFYKRFERILQSHLRATEILFAFANLLSATGLPDGSPEPFSSLIPDLVYARQNMALFQHHDGITGTAKDFVVQDYAKRMYRSFLILEQIMSHSVQTITTNAPLSPPQMAAPVTNYKLQFMERFPSEATPPRKHLFRIDSSSKSHFLLYNSLQWSLERELFCFEISWDENGGPMPEFGLVRITTSGDRSLAMVEDIQLNHCWNFDRLVTGRKEVCFQPKLPPLSLSEFCFGSRCAGTNQRLVYSKFDLQRFESFATLYNYQSHADSGSNGFTPPIDSHVLSMLDLPHNLSIQNDFMRVQFDSAGNGLMDSIGLAGPNTAFHSTNVNMKLMMYGTRKGGKNVPKSGAYIFLPDESDPKVFEPMDRPKIRVTAGRLESRYELIIDRPFPVFLRWSLSRHQRSITLVSEFHMQGLYGANRELLLRFHLPSIGNGDRFYTDLNGFQLAARKRYAKIPVQGNVYPVNTMAFIEPLSTKQTGPHQRFTVLPGQPLGVTSPRSGSLDIFLDRRLSQDDQRGLNQGVVDNRYTREQFRLMLESDVQPGDIGSPRATSSAILESQLLLNPTIGLANSEPLPQASNLLRSAPVTFLKQSFPCDLHLLNLRRATKRPDEFGLLLHRFGLSCDSTCGSNSPQTPIAPLTVTNIFADFIVERLDHTRLTKPGISLLDRKQQHGSVHFNQTLVVEPMQISAYKIYRKR